MSKKCLYCYEPLTGQGDFHETCSRKIFGSGIPPVLDYNLDDMTELAKKVVETSVAVPGVQPKLSLGLIKGTLEKTGRLTVVGALGGNYILKPPNNPFPEMPENEHLTMKMAEICSISVVPSTLIRLRSGELSYLTRRIDRTSAGDKIHMLDMYQILEAYDKYKSSLEKVGKAIHTHSVYILLDLLRFYELIIFCFITGNNDMHLKNFSLIHRSDHWELSPAYDLLNVSLHLPEDDEETALTLNGKRKRLTKNDFVSFGLKLSLNEKQIQNTFRRLIQARKKLDDLINRSFLSSENQDKYHQLISDRLFVFSKTSL